MRLCPYEPRVYQMSLKYNDKKSLRGLDLMGKAVHRKEFPKTEQTHKEFSRHQWSIPSTKQFFHRV